VAWIPRPSRADPDEARELERWHRERAARDALDEIDPGIWDPERPGATPPVDEDDPPRPALRPAPRAALYAGTFAVWVGAMSLAHEPWWTFEHGILVSIVTPFLAGRLVERLVLRRRPDWNRHEGPDVVHQRGRPALGDRARPYWALGRAPADADVVSRDVGRAGTAAGPTASDRSVPTTQRLGPPVP
jgi:hypothetical protein